MAIGSVLQQFRMSSGLLFCLLAAPVFAQQSPTPQSTTTDQTSSTPAPAPSAAQSISKPDLPDSPSATQQQQQQNSAAPAPEFQQPTGTAAAQKGKVSGSALSRPAGVAIAPVKQRRVRSLIIKMGFIAGAGIALGTVAALSMASPAKPPGAP